MPKFVYNGQILTKFKDKTAGKNKSPVDGFYETDDEPKKKYFIKKPADQRELFIEGLIGKLFIKLKEKGLIEKEYHRSLVCADFIQCEDGSYALIQPCENFDELFKLIGTGHRDGSDRDPLYEMFYGASLYPGLTNLGAYFGLSSVLMLAILVGNYSVHSGNIVVLKDEFETEQGKVKQFAGIDNGAANRDFAHPDNNGDDILIPREYKGTTNTAWFTKGYIANYQNIKNLRPSMRKHAEKLKEKLADKFGPTLFADLMTEIFKELPADLLKPEDEKTRQSLAKYMAIDGFETATFGKNGNFQAVHKDYVDTLNKRLGKLCQLQEAPALATNPSAALYQSVLFSDPPSSISAEQQEIPLSSAIDMKETISFPERMESWLEHFQHLKTPIDFTKIDYSLLTQQFSHYVDVLAHQADLYNIWGHDSSSPHNFLVPSEEMSDKAEHGYAFVPQYREGRILHHLYTFQSVEQHGFSRFTYYDKLDGEFRKTEAANGSAWQKITDALHQVQGILTAIKQLQRATDKEAFMDEEDILHFRKVLNAHLRNYLEASKQIKDLFASQTNLEPINQDSLFFYPIKDSELFKMSGDQLLTICFEELYSIQPELFEFSPLGAKIISEDKLWEKMSAAYPESTFKLRFDNKNDNKMNALATLRTNFVDCRTNLAHFHKIPTLTEKEGAFAEIEEVLDQLPPHLQAMLMQEFEGARSLLLSWQTANGTFHEKLREYYTKQTKLQKIEAYQPVMDAFYDLPNPLQQAHQKTFDEFTKDHRALVEEYKKECRFLDACGDFDAAQTLTDKLVFVANIRDAFEALPVGIKENHLDQFSQFTNFEVCHDRIVGFHQATTLPEKEQAFAEIEELLSQHIPQYRELFKEELEIANSILSTWRKKDDSFLEKHRVYYVMPTKQRTAAYQPVIDAFDELSEELRKVHQETFDAFRQSHETLVDTLRKEELYEQARRLFDAAPTLAAKIATFDQLKKAFEQLPSDVKEIFQGLFNQVKSDHENIYLKLRDNQIVDSETSSVSIEKVLLKINTSGEVAQRLKSAAISDRILWQAIATGKKEQLSTEIANDLLVLIKYRDTQVQADPSDAAYVGEINDFYQDSLSIRLSTAPIKEQASQIINAAETKFNHRDKYKRAFADVIMILGVMFGGLGAIFMLARKFVFSTSLLFSQAQTNRQTVLMDNWMQNNNELDNKEETCLFHEPPAISVK
ncbi:MULTISPECIES: LepB GTPase-activating domain-containing protein [Legionella]|uniref:Effector protein B, substrate of the Dot/Icm secretion system n=1 Tax=Legionella drozanskii LLAP-1 TaxID=1212489 RepID=A0A0W0SXS0_9GAMM|nr:MULTISPECIES: LepB GTPase-activating domain-containing protein [Legionella]KTC88139.1 effector protein B, substrate of the Dot/Icm secretion system [Legionella drozanskii LLAP-1]PJE07963.1 MAG: hypothetical protein CK430_13135 [Legionella sp.]